MYNLKNFDLAWLVDLVNVNGLSNQNISPYTSLKYHYVLSLYVPTNAL
jgi:hypothetical protein